MKIRTLTVLAGMFFLAHFESAPAHDSGRYDRYPDNNWSGNASVWIGPQGYSGWSGNFSYGALPGYAPGYIPWVAPLPPGHRHGPSCHHPPAYGYAKAHRKGYKHGRGHGYSQGYGPERGHHH
jgi:hypothetical protein